MGCYLIKGACACLEIEKELKSQGGLEENDSSEHDIWQNSKSLQKEFEYSISKAVFSVSSGSSSSEKEDNSKKSDDNLTVRTVQLEKEKVISIDKRAAFLKSKTLGN